MPVSRPASTAPRRRGRSGAGTAAGPRAPRGRPRPSRPPGRSPRRAAGRRRPPRASSAAAAGQRFLGVRRVGAGLEHAAADRAVEQAGVEEREAQRVGQPPRQRALAGRGRAVDRDDERAGHDASAGSMRHPRPFIRPRKPGKLVSMASAPSTVTGSPGQAAQHEEAHGDPVVELGVDRPRRRRAARRPRRSGRRPRPRTRTPQAARPCAMVARRSLSLTRSSARPRMTVRPRANAAATARIGYSSIMLGARSGGTSTPPRSAASDHEIGHRLAAGDALVRRRRMSAPISRSVV